MRYDFRFRCRLYRAYVEYGENPVRALSAFFERLYRW